jgi:hypothetical protein
MPPESAAPAVVSAPMAALPYTPPQTAASAASAPASSAPPPPPAPPPVAGDPLNEAPGAVWYVRPASGGQFGPATADVMRGWLAEGRVGADTLVWREGWREWQEASATFPQLKPDEAAEFFTGLSSASTTPSTPVAGGSHVQPLPSQRHSNASSAVIIVVLVIAVLVLLAVLLMALLKSPNDEKGPGTNPKAAVLLLNPRLPPGEGRVRGTRQRFGNFPGLCCYERGSWGWWDRWQFPLTLPSREGRGEL